MTQFSWGSKVHISGNSFAAVSIIINANFFADIKLNGIKEFV